jgi:hypothetical protein
VTLILVGDPRLDVEAVTERCVKACVQLRQVGHTYEEISRRVGLDAEQCKAFVEEHCPSHADDESKPWHMARRTRLLARQERDEIGPRTLAARYASVLLAIRNGDMNSLQGSLRDVAIASMAWIERLERQREWLLPTQNGNGRKRR